MHLSPFDDLDAGTRSTRVRPPRRIAEILSVLFLASLGTVATVTSARADAQITATGVTSTTAR